MSDESARVVTLESAELFLDAAPDPIVIADMDGRIVFVNQQVTGVLGYAPAEIVGQTVEELMPKPLRAGHDEHRALYSEEPHWRSMAATTSRVVALHADGHELPVEISLSPITVDGELRVMAAIRDVSERLAAEERLRESETSFRAAFDDAPVAMAMLDLDSGQHRVVQANESLGRLVGARPQDLVQTPLEELVQNDDLTSLVELIEGNESTTTEVRVRWKRGDAVVWVWAHSAEISMGGRRCALMHMIDVSRRVEAESDRDHREAFLTALGDIRSEIVTERTSARVLDLITQHCAELWPGSSAVVAYADSGGAIVARAVAGETTDYVEDEIFDTSSTAVGAALRTRTTVGVDDVNDGRGTTIVAPFAGIGHLEGALIVMFPGRASPATRTMVEALATEASLSIELERAIRERRRQLVTIDRERIARDLHDLVIQRLFAAGMRLQSAVGSPRELESRAQEVIHELDETITEIRNTIFKLTEPDTSLREQLGAMLAMFVAPLDTTLSTSISGDLGRVPDDVASHLLATVNEAISNALRHSEASEISVSVAVTEGDGLTLRVIDDGIGIGRLSSSGRGLTNMAERAAAAGGSMSINSHVDGGTELTWTVSLVAG